MRSLSPTVVAGGRKEGRWGGGDGFGVGLRNLRRGGRGGGDDAMVVMEWEGREAMENYI